RGLRRAGSRALVHGVDGVAEEIDEHLHDAVGIAPRGEVGGDAVLELNLASLAVETDKWPGSVDQGSQGGGLAVVRADAGEIEQALAEPSEPPAHAEHEGRLLRADAGGRRWLSAAGRGLALHGGVEPLDHAL